MAGFRNYNIEFMKTLKSIFLGILLIFLAFSCKKDEIDVYRVEDSAVQFTSQTNAFSLRGLMDPLDTLMVQLSLIGPIVDYDRPVSVMISDNPRNTAEENTDFRILESVVRAGEMYGTIAIEVNNLQEGVEELVTTMRLQPNEYFRNGTKTLMSSIVSWSEMYARPTNFKVWEAWYAFFSHGYSRNYHNILINIFGEEIEKMTYKPLLDADIAEGIIREQVGWWYAAQRTLRDYVRNYDREHPDAPLMHSDDYEFYNSESTAVGNGTKPDEIPTIYETLL